MFTQCLQTRGDGEQCAAPAVNGSKFCRHHDPTRPQQEARPQNNAKSKSAEPDPLYLPPLVDKQSMLVALNLVVRALGERRIKCSVASTLLSAIRFADRLVTEIQNAGLSVYPTRQPANPVARPTSPTNPTPASSSYITGKVALAASGNHPNAPGANPLPKGFMEEVLAQAYAFPSKAPKPDPRFTRP